MSVPSLRGKWDTPPEFALSKETDFLDNSQRSIGVKVKDGKIESITFYFLGFGVTPFSEPTTEGVSAASSIEQVKAVYGDPSYIWRHVHSDALDFPGAEECDSQDLSNAISDFTFSIHPKNCTAVGANSTKARKLRTYQRNKFMSNTRIGQCRSVREASASFFTKTRA